MQCPQCQAENREGLRFCAQCGASMAVHGELVIRHAQVDEPPDPPSCLELLQLFLKRPDPNHAPEKIEKRGIWRGIGGGAGTS